MNLNIGFVLDEGLPNDEPDEASVYYTSRPAACKMGNYMLIYTGAPVHIGKVAVQHLFKFKCGTLTGVKFKAVGSSGHGSLLLNDTAAEKIVKVLNKFLGMREAERVRLYSSKSVKLGDVTTINLSILEVPIYY
jgi:hypothetical protein